MLDFLIQKCLKNRRTVLGFFILMSLLGATLVSHLPIDAVPDITNVQVMINAQTGALDPGRIEKTVTNVIETEMAGLPGLEDIRSLSKYGLSQVVLIFKDGTDLYFIRSQVAQRLQNLSSELPPSITPELAPITTGLGEVVMYTVDAKPGSPLASQSENQRLLYLRTIQDYVIRPELKKIQGVAEVDSSGGYRKEIHINANTQAMEKFGITFDDLQKRLQSLGDSFGGGYIQKSGQQIIVRTTAHLPDLKTLGAIPIKVNFRGAPVRLRDIAGVREDHTQRLGAATSGGNEAVLGTALMYIGANSREVAEEVRQGILRLPLPKDVQANIVYTRSYLVNQTIKTVLKNLAEGAGLVIVVLLLLLGNLRAAVAVALAIPVSMLFAVIGMRYFGISANLMSLGAIDFGLLVDGSVVMIENLLRHLEAQKTKISFEQKIVLVFRSAKEVAKPVGLGLLIIMIVYVPILSLQGIEGKMFHPMAVTVLMALAASLLVALLLMPVIGIMFLNPSFHQPSKPSKTFEFMARWYEPILLWSLRQRVLLLSATLVFALASVFMFNRLGSDFIPPLDEGDLVAGLVRDTSIGLDESIKEQKKAESIILQFPEVQSVFSRMGTPESATDPMGVNFADTFIILKKDHADWPGGRSKLELMEAISERIKKDLPGHEISPTQPIAMRFNEILEGSRADVSLRIYGPDLNRLMTYIDQSKELIEKIPGVTEAEMDSLTALRKSPVLNIDLNYGAMAKFGVSLLEANSTLMMAMGGIQVGNFYEEDRRFPIVLHLAEELREKPEEIARIPISLPDGGSVPLKSIADFTEAEQVTTIARSFGKRYSALSIFLQGRDVGSFVEEAKRQIGKNLEMDAGYTIEWGGQFKNLERAKLRLMLIIPVTLILIFLLLLKEIQSLRLTLLVYSCIPLALTGGVLSLSLRGIPFSISAAIGFIALLGIAILNGMVLVDYINQLKSMGYTVKDAVLTGAQTRLRPVITTALVAGLGFIPMAFNSGLGAEVQRPLATVVIGGILTSTILTLLLLPSLYLWMEDRKT